MGKEQPCNFYVYLHINTETREPFYVGKGNGNRAFAKTRRSQRWLNYINVHEYEVIMLYTDLSDIEALILEKEVIKKYGRKDNNTGSLINMTDGGEGSAGAIRSEESRKKTGDALRGRCLSEEHKQKLRNANSGKKLSPERCKKMVETSKLRYEKYGSPFGQMTEEWKANISKGLLNSKLNKNNF